MHILVTNDDGVHAPGLVALARALKPLGEITVLAPNRNWSASGHVKTLDRPLRVDETQLSDGTPALSTDGAPSDCVALAALGLLESEVDVVVSGINPNANVGHDVTYSGTVTAAMEAAISGMTGIAISLDAPEHHDGPLDFTPAGKVAASLLAQCVTEDQNHTLILNVNVPYLPSEDMAGIALTKQGLRVYRDALERRRDPRGRPYYWIGGDSPTGVPDEGTDIWALRHGMVSVTPLHLDLTCHQCLQELRELELTLSRFGPLERDG
jgi:5'-nucleotidase